MVQRTVQLLNAHKAAITLMVEVCNSYFSLTVVFHYPANTHVTNIVVLLWAVIVLSVSWAYLILCMVI